MFTKIYKIRLSLTTIPVNLFYYYSTVTYQFNETIYALSSGQGKSGVAVIRVSGKDSKLAVFKLLNRTTLLKPRYAYLTRIYNPITKELLDKGLVLWFPGPNSFTGEDVCEFQVHGGTAIISSILQSLQSLDNFRLARPGEFTKRAFYNKKLDLVEAEGLADLINAETEMQRKQVLFQGKKKAAIVTPYPGTTRDTLEYYIDLFGYPVILYDTCGIRYRDVNLIEAEGVQITLDTIKSSELLILVIDAGKYHVWLNHTANGDLLCYVKDYIINELQVPDIINRDATTLRYLFQKRCLIVLNKIDKIEIPMEDEDLKDVSCISVSTNAGLEQFLNNIKRKLTDICAEPSIENPAITKLRHRNLLETCQDNLNQYLEDVENSTLDYALLGNNLRCALRSLTEIIEGRRDNRPVNDVLDEIFHNFCVGK
ncbi:trna modification gtpase gtpbp3 [Holotrichia oblita]|uniref:Trna modification gtpase gtpbp3 n=1 Tax=Holotrichia oblita TaxID=644536 RepID=A0ACB9SGC1_HOLOL|nr:trna modification gtpase gtpbp3 [Holotrichia oblita]